MRLFLIGWGDYVPEMITVAKELQRHSHQIVYWTRSTANFALDTSPFPNTIFHITEEALRLQPAPGVPADSFEPPSAGLLEKLYSLESVVLTNMNKKFELQSLTERKRVYYRMVRYWYGVLRKYAPEAIVFGFVPHTVYDYIIYGLARQLGIKTIIFNETMIEDWLLLTEDFVQGYPELRQELERSAGQMFSVPDLSPAMQHYYQQKIAAGRDATPGYMLKDYARFSGLNLFKKKLAAASAGLRNLSIFKQALAFARKKIAGANLRHEYQRVQATPDLNKKYVYVAMNYQPECTTSPQGGVFVDQILMIETLAAALPPDWVIYVKEHPYQWMPRGANYSSYRYPDFYESISRIPRVSLVPVTMSSYELTDRAQAVATVTGTPGWEAILRGKPALTFGFPWYEDYPDLLRVDNVASCRQALEKVAGGFKPNQATTLHFIKCLETVAFRGHIDIYTESVTRLTPQENIQNVLSHLIPHLI